MHAKESYKCCVHLPTRKDVTIVANNINVRTIPIRDSHNSDSSSPAAGPGIFGLLFRLIF